MTIKRLQPLIKAIPIVLGASLITTIPVRASEQPDNQAQSSGSNPTVAEGIRFADPHARHSIIPSVDGSDLVITGAIAPEENLDLHSEYTASPRYADLIDGLAEASTITDQTEVPDSTTQLFSEATDSIEIPTSDSESIYEDSESNAESEGSSEPTPSEMDVEDAETPSSPRWRFTFEPYVYIPISVNGDVGIEGFDTRFGEDSDLGDVGRAIDIDIDTNVTNVIETARESSFFGFMGRSEAWRNRLGIIFDGSYLSVQQSNTTSLNVPDSLSNSDPSDIEVDTHFRYGQFDLGAGYRFTDGNLTEAETDFDLGPIVFDAIGGLRIYAISSGVDIDTNLDRVGVELDKDTTFVTPLLSSRLRWNMSHNLALSMRGDIAGFGVHGMNLAWSATTGLDWMVAGDTSLFVGYRVSSIDYSRDSGDRDLDVDLLFHGPYLGTVFRL